MALNFKHLHHFAMIAREGSLSRAATKLHVTHSTLSAQVKLLEEHFGVALFERRGKRLHLTAFGVEAAADAEDIFRLGRELDDVAHGRGSSGRELLRVGVVPGVPKPLVHHLLGPSLDHPHAGVTTVVQGSSAVLLEALVSGRLHVVLTNETPTAHAGTRTHAHVLGETRIALHAVAALARKLRRDFPRSLAGQPFVLPPATTALRRRLDDWLLQRGLTVRPVIEVEDAGLLRAFGGAGRGIFPVRAALALELEDVHDVAEVGDCEGIRERYYAITVERRIRHAAVAALVESARENLLATLELEHRRSRAKRTAAPNR